MRRVKKYQNFSFIGKGKKHLKGFIEKNGKLFEIIAYNFREYEEYLQNYDTFDILFFPEFNVWTGENSIQLKIKDIKRSE
jgi:single-stranded-DNA-specific exonuclease